MSVALQIVKNVVVNTYGVLLVTVLAEFLFGYDYLHNSIRLSVVVILLLWIFFGVTRGVWSFFDSPYRNAVGQRVPLVPKREKKMASGSNDLFEYALVEVQGWRPAMEDASLIELFFDDARLKPWSLFAVFDGHGGDQVSRWLSENVVQVLQQTLDALYPDATVLSAQEVEACMRSTCRTLDANLRVFGYFDFVGSTLNWVMMDANTLICANVGDSRCIYSTGGKAVDVSVDHKPERKSERERIENAGGCVCQTGPCYRVDGCGLNLSRAFGDFHYKQRLDLPVAEQKVCAEPETFIVDLHRDPIDFIIIGCDGVFELPSQEIADVVHNSLKTDGLRSAVAGIAHRCISPSLIQTQGRGGDNVSAIVITIKNNNRKSERRSIEEVSRNSEEDSCRQRIESNEIGE